MINIALTAIPNQSLSVRLNNQQFDLRIHDCGNSVMTLDISINETVVITGIRMVPNYPIIAAEYLENGNFILQTANFEYPDWTRFGVDQYLIYASQAEIEEI